MTGYIQVLTAIDTRARAQEIARMAVARRLAACAQVIGPITSTYWWQGQVETAEEFLCLMKTKANLYQKLEQAIQEAHPYRVPEILALPVTAGLETYLAWVEESVAPK